MINPNENDIVLITTNDTNSCDKCYETKKKSDKLTYLIRNKLHNPITYTTYKPILSFTYHTRLGK